MPPAASPIRRQYLTLKRQQPGAVLFFQLGDFYETFDDDARLVATVCDVALTARDMGRGERVPMAGVPVHAADVYIARLVDHGHHIAICDQVETSSAAASRAGASLVRREITRVITPGTLVEPSLLSATRSSYLAALSVTRFAAGLAYVDASTGEFACAQIDGPGCHELAMAELARLRPAECLLAGSDLAADLLPHGTSVTSDRALFTPTGAGPSLCEHFRVAAVDALGLAGGSQAVLAAGAILRYLGRTQSRAGTVIQRLRVYDPRGYMVIDPSTREHLELVGPGDRRRAGSLLSTLDRTETPMGARVLSGWLGHPLLDSDAIEQRLDAVTALVDRRGLRRSIREGLAGLPDLERLGGRAGQRLLTPREALALADGLERATELRRVVDDSLETEVWLGSLAPRLDLPDHLPEEIRATLADDATRDFGEGLIRPGRVPELDALRGESSRGRDWLLTLERAERERTGVKNLKVGYNRVFGYYLEVSTAALKQELDYYRREETRARTVAELLTALGYERRQTLASVERYVTAELREHEARQSRSTTRMAQLEREAFDALVQRAASEAPRLMLAGTAFGELDALACMADVADERGYVRPEIVVEPDLELEGGRHPMVEASLGWDAYLPADLHLRALDSVSPPAEDPTHPGCVMVLTGPNMAGKTTYGRMALLVVVLAQSGCFVPATRARVGLVDRVFLRSGAGDDISGGRSTFMTEMTETSAILRQVTPRSLAFFDEVGRGTSTYDGMAIARAIVEYLAQPPRGCRTIFSTHYHELAEVERYQPGVRNRRMEVEELADRVVFTYRVEPGAADRSYGVHVAELAGLPTEVVHRAHYLLAELERGEVSARPASNVPPAPSGEAALARRLASIDVERLTPIEALNVLADLRRRAADLAGDDADIS